MQRYLLLLLPSLLVILPGCSKFLPSPEDKLEGTWQLKIAERSSLFNWNTINTGYEAGKFSFNNNGSANYEDGIIRMNGNWRMRLVKDGYYDNGGNYQDDSRRKLTINLFNFNENRILNLDFDRFHFNGRNRLIAEYISPFYRYRYEFVRF